MEGVLSPTHKQSMVSYFLEISVGQTAETARQFLQATSWKLDEAIQLFYVGIEGGAVASSLYLPSEENATLSADQSSSEFSEQDGVDDVRPPLLVIREALYDDAMFYGQNSLLLLRTSGSWQICSLQQNLAHICLIETPGVMKLLLKLSKPILSFGRWESEVRDI